MKINKLIVNYLEKKMHTIVLFIYNNYPEVAGRCFSLFVLKFIFILADSSCHHSLKVTLPCCYTFF